MLAQFLEGIDSIFGFSLVKFDEENVNNLEERIHFYFESAAYLSAECLSAECLSADCLSNC